MKLNHLLLALAIPAFSLVSAQKKPLDQSVYDGWKSIRSATLSDDGAWAHYVIAPRRGDGALEFYRIADGQKSRFERGAGPAFFNNATWARFSIAPAFDTVRQAKIKKTKKENMPKDTAAIVRLSDMSLTRLPDAKGLTASSKGPLVLYTYEVKQKPDSTASEKDKKKKEIKFDRLVIFDVVKGDSVTVDSVKSFAVTESGNAVLYSREADSLKAVYLYTTDPKHGARHTELWQSQLGAISGTFAFDLKGEQGAFLATSDTLKSALYDLYHFRVANPNKPVKIDNSRVQGLPEGYAISRYGALRFQEEGHYLQFAIAPKPKPEPPKDTLPDDEKFSLDLWSWNDTLVQPQQLKGRKRLAERSYTAIYFPQENRALALGDYHLESIRLAENPAAPYALGTTSVPYAMYSENQIRPYNPSDTYLIDLKSGKRTLIREAGYGGSYLSPSAKYVAYYSPADSSWYSIDTKTLQHTRVAGDIPYPFWNEDDDHPGTKPLYGFYGWTTDEQMLIPDRYDLWVVDPTAKAASRNLTVVGRETDTQFRFTNLVRTPGKSAVDLSKPMFFVSFNRVNKDNGYYRLEPGAPIRRLAEGPYIYRMTSYAKQGDRILYSRESFNDFPDLWHSDERFAQSTRITDANPQQADYLWGSVDLIKWVDLNGNECEGLLYLPEDYDPSKPYPTIVYFYEKQAWVRHEYKAPGPSRSIIMPAYCTSNGYVVFMPDIKYRDGFPGQSCYDAVLSGTLALIERGIADRKHIGLQGQSWGGYQTAWLVTQTDLYACSAPGAAVSNMFSAYGGIRWGTGNPRVYQYETGQSRIGATPWQRRDLYIDNSPIFFADRVHTPQLLRHSDQDGAVPWYQSIEYYIALRRLGRPVWMLNYSGDDHNLMSYAACMDWDKRMYQFFDHYLKGAPMPRWMAEGISALEKNVDQKLELIEPDVEADPFE